MPYVINVTPFQALGTEHRFYNGYPYDCLFVKATFRICHDGQLRPLVKQPPFVLNDVHEGGEDTSALRYPSEITPFKVATDVIVIGNAKPPGGTPREQWAARVKVGGVDKTVRLTGPRHWRRKGLGKWEITPIEPCSSVALSYSLAYGGASAERREEADLFWPNPIGRGLPGRDKIDKARQYGAPRILSLADGEPRWGVEMRAVGLSAMDGKQMDSLQFPGTYDGNWKRNVAPNIPLDMRLEFWNVVPQDQVARPHLEGGEQVHTAGLFPTDDGRLSSVLPRYQVFAVPARGEIKESSLPLDIDTVLIELDKRHVSIRCATLCSQTDGYDEYQLIALEHKAAESASKRPDHPLPLRQARPADRHHRRPGARPSISPTTAPASSPATLAAQSSAPTTPTTPGATWPASPTHSAKSPATSTTRWAAYWRSLTRTGPPSASTTMAPVG